MKNTFRFYNFAICEIKNLFTFSKQLLLGLSLLVYITQADAQVSITTDGSNPDPDAMLDVKSTYKGILIPRMTTAQRTTINGGSPVTGLLVFDNTTSSFWYYGGTVWEELISDGVDKIVDADDDTKIQVEESADEDYIRFDIAGTERLVMQGACLEVMNSGNSVFIGEGAGVNDDLSSNNNVFVGYQAGKTNTTGISNVGVGYQALYTNTTGKENTANGIEALYSNTTGNYNTASGRRSLYTNTTGYVNTASGYQALYSNTTGYQNTASGYEALYKNTTGNYNTGNGLGALYSNTTGHSNTASGCQTLYKNTTGNYNTASGYIALYSNTTASYTTASGYRALYSNTTGIKNTASGCDALYFNTTGNSNTALGYSAFSSGSSYVNSTALGYDAEPSASNTIRLGGSGVSTIGGYAAWTNVSDGRFKINITENVVGLDFIMQLRPITYNLDMDAIARFNHTPDSLRLMESEQLKAAELQSGFIAQEVEVAANALGYDFHGVDKPKNETSHYGLRYAEFVVPIVKAMQEQQQLIEAQQKANEDLQQQIDELKKLIGKI